MAASIVSRGILVSVSEDKYYIFTRYASPMSRGSYLPDVGFFIFLICEFLDEIEVEFVLEQNSIIGRCIISKYRDSQNRIAA